MTDPTFQMKTGTPPPSARGRNGQWSQRMVTIRRHLAAGYVVPPGDWIVFAEDINANTAGKIAYTYRRRHPDFEFLAACHGDQGTVWCRPK